MTPAPTPRLAPLCAALMLAAALLLGGCTPAVEAPKVVRGGVDLSSWNFETQGPVRLSGDWEFFWNPADEGLPQADARTTPDYFPVPGLWRGQSAAGQMIVPHGNAVYRLLLRMPETQHGKMAVLASGGLSVCEIWINGVRMAAGGELGFSKADEKPRRHYVVAQCPESWRILEIAIKVSNHHNVSGGLYGMVLLGTAEQINNFYRTPWLLAACMAGALVCLSLLYATLFVMRRKGREYLYFSLFCLAWGTAILFSPSSGFLMAQIAPSIPWGWYIAASMLPYGLTNPLLLTFYHSLFPKRFRKPVERTCWALSLAYMAFILLTPPHAYGPVVMTYFLMGCLVLLYLFVCFVMDLVRREQGTGILFLGYLALGLAELDDMLFDLHYIDVPSLRPIGVFVFILSYAFYLAYRFSLSFNRAEQLGAELEAANKRLLRLDGLKDEFLVNTTHELKTPLAGMIGIAESLLAGAGGALSEAASGPLRTIVASGRRLSKLINDVLDFSRLKHEDIALKPAAVDLRPAVGRVLALVGALKRDEVALENAVPEDLPAVLADPDRLEQILLNLVGNALRYTDAGRVLVQARVRGGFAEIVVEDTGRGIAPEDMERIFEPYEQAGEGVPGGTGIGLSITRQLVELHGGLLEAASRPGQGSAFTFSLPLADRAKHGDAPAQPAMPVVAEAPSAPVPAHAAEAGPGRYQVLVVDDEPVNLEVVASILGLAGITFRTARDGVAALRLIEGGDRPQMVLLDVMMPHMNGYAVCRELRRRYSPSALPIVLLTVKSRAEDVVEGFSCGANDYLTKPFSRDELSARVTTQLKLKEAYAALAENAELRHELNLRRKTETQLRFWRARLGKIFDTLEDALLVVNPSGEIVFCNAAFKGFVLCDGDGLPGQELTTLLAAPASGPSVALLDFCRSLPGAEEASSVFAGVDIRTAGGDVGVSLTASRVEVEEETLCLLVARLSGGAQATGAAALPLHLLQDLDANRRRVQALEDALLTPESADPGQHKLLAESIRSLDGLLGQISAHVQDGSQPQEKRALAVKVMNLAVDCWVEATGSTKADMAEQSGLWNVYMERDGYSRTQTLDKYLDEETLPQKPRWKMVFVTADYVLANCPEDLPIRRELEETLGRLTALYAQR